MDLVMQAMSGIIDSTGYPDQPPVKSGAAICDFMAGIHLYAAIATALYERERTGVGRVVAVSMQEAVFASLASNLVMLHARGDAAPTPPGNRPGGLGLSPYNVSPAQGRSGKRRVGQGSVRTEQVRVAAESYKN